MLHKLLMAVPLALAWMLLTANVSLESFGVGLLLSYAVLTLLFSGERQPDRKPQSQSLAVLVDRVVASVAYFLILCRDIYLSTMDVAKRVVSRDMRLNPGIIAVSTQFTVQDGNTFTADTIAAVSAHGITITPGELVVDFDGNQIMYVHCLDTTASLQVAESNQAKRLALLKRVLQ